MLQMSCPNCRGVINSLFLADVSTFECSECKEEIPVRDIFITTKYFTISRDDLNNRIFRFKRLLREVEEERVLMANSKEASTKSIASLEKFYTSLQELLVGARDNYRMEFHRDLYVELSVNDRKNKGKLLNLSTEGCSIELVEYTKIPRRNSKLELDFSFPESSESLYINAQVVWAKEQIDDDESKYAIIGVTFTDIDAATRSCIWNYILDNALVPFQSASRSSL